MSKRIVPIIYVTIDFTQQRNNEQFFYCEIIIWYTTCYCQHALIESECMKSKLLRNIYPFENADIHIPLWKIFRSLTPCLSNSSTNASACMLRSWVKHLNLLVQLCISIFSNQPKLFLPCKLNPQKRGHVFFFFSWSCNLIQIKLPKNSAQTKQKLFAAINCFLT